MGYRETMCTLCYNNNRSEQCVDASEIINRFQPKCYRGGNNYCALLCFHLDMIKANKKDVSLLLLAHVAQHRSGLHNILKIIQLIILYSIAGLSSLFLIHTFFNISNRFSTQSILFNSLLYICYFYHIHIIDKTYSLNFVIKDASVSRIDLQFVSSHNR